MKTHKMPFEGFSKKHLESLKEAVDPSGPALDFAPEDLLKAASRGKGRTAATAKQDVEALKKAVDPSGPALDFVPEELMKAARRSSSSRSKDDAAPTL